MKVVRTLLFSSIMMLTAISTGAQAQNSARKTLFNAGWKFHLGSVANAEQPSYNDGKWRTLDLPHDWSVEPLPRQKEGITLGPFSRMSIGRWDTGQTVGGEGWYRKEFTIPAEDAGKLLSLHFEGAYNQAEVWINGKKACFNPYGYMPFRIDLNEYCHAPGVVNTIAVRVINEGLNSRWYAGSGIYRHVWLMKTEPVHLDEWDTHVDASRLQGKEAVINISTILYNKGKQAADARLDIRILSPKGDAVYATTETIPVSANGQTPKSLSFNLKKPELWSVDAPSLYTAQISLSEKGKKTDAIEIPFGIRTIEFSAQKGFLLNGKPLELKGGCLHHDNGLLGAVAIDRAEERKVELMRANGYNAVRCSHNLPSEHFLHACDRLGMLVIDEVFDQWIQAKRPQDYHQYFTEYSDRDMATMIRRDRNHPSIILWSIGNEIADRADPHGVEIAQRLNAIIKKYDESRYSTAGVNEFWDRRHYTWAGDSERAFRHLDVAGYNYMWKEYENDHAAHPGRVIYGSESFPKEAAKNWNLVEKHPYIIGDFVWTSIDYLGEAGLAHNLELAQGERNPQFMDWPWYNAWCGDIDFCGDKKPQSYYRDILWRERGIAMAVQPPVAPGKREIVNGWGWPGELLSWTWKGREGETMKVNVYSRSPRVKLYLNDRLVGEKETGKEDYTATFEVPYEAGVLKAVNADRNKESFTLQTTGKPASIRLSADRQRINAHKNDLSFIKIELVDEAGELVTDSDIPVAIQCGGAGSVIASGNAAFDDMKSFRSLTPNTFRGVAMAIVQPDGMKGEVTLTVSAAGLKDTTITINTD